MELKRILAKDSRRALEKVSDEYGNDALVISSAKVNGQTENSAQYEMIKRNIARLYSNIKNTNK